MSQEQTSGNENPAPVVEEPVPQISHHELTKLMYSASMAASRIKENELTASQPTEHELVAAAERDRTDTWLAAATETDRRHITFVEGQAQLFLQQRIEADRDPKGKKSVTTPWGSVSSKALPREYTREDEEALFAWAKANGFTRVVETEELEWGKLKAAAEVQKDGTLIVEGKGVVKGVRVEAQQRQYTIRIDDR